MSLLFAYSLSHTLSSPKIWEGCVSVYVIDKLCKDTCQQQANIVIAAALWGQILSEMYSVGAERKNMSKFAMFITLFSALQFWILFVRACLRTSHTCSQMLLKLREKIHNCLFSAWRIFVTAGGSFTWNNQRLLNFEVSVLDHAAPASVVIWRQGV